MPWTLIFNVVLKFISFGLGKVQASEEAKKRFLDFVADMENESLASVNLNEQDRQQTDELRARRDKLSQAQKQGGNHGS